MTLFIIGKVLNWFIKRKRDINDRIDSYLGGLIFRTDITDEDYEKLHWGDLVKKIEEEPNNPYNYYYRGNMRINKWRNYRLGVIEDFTQVIRIVLADREKYPDIDLSFCYYSICQTANIHSNILMEEKYFMKAAKYCKLSISSGQEFLQCEDRRKMYEIGCNDCMNRSSEQLMLIQDLTKDFENVGSMEEL